MTQPNEATLMVIEDEYLIAVGLEMALERAGYTVLEPLASVEDALAAVALQNADLALLDINLSGHRTYVVADALAAQQVPFIFLSGCSTDELPPRFAAIPHLNKPFQQDKLLSTIRLALEAVQAADQI